MLAWARPSQAADFEWSSPTTGGTWSTTTAWNPTAPSGGPGSADTATLGNATADRIVTVDSAAAATVGGIVFDQTDAFANELLVRRNFTVTAPIVLGAAAGLERLGTLPSTDSSITLTASGGVTVNAGGELVLGASSVSGSTSRLGQFTGHVTLAGGSLIVAPTIQDGGTGTGGTNTLTGTLTMSSGTLAIDRGAPAGDRRLSLAGDVSITGGSITNPGGGSTLEFNGPTAVFSPDSIGTLALGLRANGNQSFTFGIAFTNGMNVSSNSAAGAVKTITSLNPATATIGGLALIDQNSGGTNTGVTVRLGSDLSTGSAALPFATNFSHSAESGRIDVGIDAATHTFDMSGNSGIWTPNASTQSGVTDTVWTLSGDGGTIKARGFNLSTAGTTTNVGVGLVLESTGPDGVANTLSGTGTIAGTAVFRYSGSATAANPATLTSNRALGRVEVTGGNLRLNDLANVGSTAVGLSAGGTLILPNAVDDAAVATILANPGSSFAPGSALGFDTGFGGAAGNREYSAAIGGNVGLTKTGNNTLTLSAASTFTGTARAAAGTLAITADQSATERAYMVGIGGVNLAAAASLTTAAGADLAASSFTIDAHAGDPQASATIASTVTNAGPLAVNTRGGSLAIAAGGDWNQQGPISLQTNGGRNTFLNILTGGSLTNTGGTIGISPATNNTGRTDLAIAGGILTTNGGFERADASTTGLGSRVLLSAGGTLAISQTIPSLIVGSRPVSFEVGAGGGTLDTGAFSTALSADITGAGRLTKTGSGTLTLSGASTFAGTTIAAGTVALAGGDDRLATGQSVTFGGTSRLALGTTNQTVTALTTSELQSVAATITGSGTLTINGAADTLLGPIGTSQAASYAVAYDLSGLSAFAVNTPGRTFRVSFQGSTTSGSIAPVASLVLAPTSSITTGLLAVADQGGNATGGAATLTLGAATTINAGTINVGYSGRSSGTIEFAAGGSPTLTVRGAAGGSAALPQWLVSRVSSNNDVAWTSTVDLSGGTLDAIVTTLEIGTGNTTVADRRGTANGFFTMGAGTLSVGTLRIGTVAGSGSGTVSANGPLVGNGTFTLANAAGLVEAASVQLATNTITTSTGPGRVTSGTLAIAAGTLRAGEIRLGDQTGTATSVTAALNWTGGMIENEAGSDLAITGVPITVASGTGTFHATGSSTITVVATSPISGGGGLAKTGSGVLALAGANAYAGATAVSGGTLLVNGNQAAAGGAVSVAAGATLGGSGTLGGAVSILDGGILSPGTSPGTLSMTSALSLAGTSILNFEFDAQNTAIGGGINDLVTGVTDLTLGGVLNVTGPGDWTAVADDTAWRLFNYTGQMTDNGLTLGLTPTLAAGQSFRIDTATDGQVNLVVVPEPGPIAGLAALAVALTAWRRARRPCGNRHFSGRDEDLGGAPRG